MGAFINFNGSFVEEDTPVVSAGNRGLRYGDGVFETMKVKDGIIKLSRFHFERLFEGLAVLRIRFSNHLNATYFEEQVLNTISKNKLKGAVRVRLMVFRGSGGLYEIDSPPIFIIECWKLSASKLELNENGLEIGIYKEVQKSCDRLSNLKSNNYLLYVMAALFAKENKYNDCLILNVHNRICESTISNVFWIKNEIVYTPPLTEGCVAGVMRRHLLHTLPAAGYIVQEKIISADEIQTADELFLSNAIGLRWVRTLNHKLFKNHFSKSIFRSTISAE
ncbi:MAG: aminotransferase class IV [Flavitalea sp.]